VVGFTPRDLDFDIDGTARVPKAVSNLN
jgi:hypothetical protein